MSFLYSKKTKTAIAWIWGIIVVLITFSMVIAYSGLTNYFNQSPAASASTQTTAPASNTPNVTVTPVTASSSTAVTAKVVPATTTPAATWGIK